MEPKAIGKYELDKKNFVLVARKGEQDITLMIDENDSITGDCSLDFQIFKRTDIIPKIVKYGMTYEEVAEFCHQEYEKAGNILVILNTKKSAKTIYELMKDMSYSDCPIIIHLSTNMCPAHCVWLLYSVSILVAL